MLWGDVQIGRELQQPLAAMPSETSSAMRHRSRVSRVTAARCIHYDRPMESRGDGDLEASSWFIRVPRLTRAALPGAPRASSHRNSRSMPSFVPQEIQTLRCDWLG